MGSIQSIFIRTSAGKNWRPQKFFIGKEVQDRIVRGLGIVAVVVDNLSGDHGVANLGACGLTLILGFVT